jgi:integrase
MSVRLAQYKGNRWMVDLRVRLSDGERHRERTVISARSKTAARRWAEQREHHLLEHGPAAETKEVPTVEEFAPRFINGHARANRQKPSGIAAKETILNQHLIPFLGQKKLEAISTEHVQQLKTRLGKRSNKTVNNVLTVLNTLLKKAVEWDVIEQMPCTIKLLRVAKPKASFYDFEEFDRVLAATDNNPQARLIVLLGGDAGLRCGEIMALEWSDVDQQQRRIRVARSEWKGHITLPKGGRERLIPMTKRLAEALRHARHMRGSRVLCDDSGEPLTQKMVQVVMRRVARRANVKAGVHILRHTFCSHLAMRGVPARSIQELAGHEDLSTTSRYMHLSPAAVEDAIRVLETPRFVVGGGNTEATATGEAVN